jgi:hypothetical protein
VLAIKGYITFAFGDFSWIGLLLAAFGAIQLFRHKKNFFIFLSFAFMCLGPGFFFYASFPFANAFTLGTYERFLLPSYIILYLFIGAGFSYLFDIIELIMKKISSLPMPVWIAGVFLVLSVYPLAIGSITLWRFTGLARDATGDNLGRDILTSLPHNSILLLSRDTTLFTTQYVRYALNVRPDIKVLHIGRLASPEYFESIKYNFPDLTLPASTNRDSLVELIKLNADKYPVFTSLEFFIDSSWYWVPFGLVYKLVSHDALPPVDRMYADNMVLWGKFHDPATGILSRYNHLMLSDIRDVYAGSRMTLGKLLLKANKGDPAKEQFMAAIAYHSDSQTADAYAYVGLVELFAKNCKEALGAFSKAREASLVPGIELTLYEATTYRDCVGDTKKANELFDLFAKQKRKQETPLAK